MRPVGQGRQLGPGDRPPELLDFDEAAWAEPCPSDCSCDPESPASPHGYQAARDRWSKAKFAWCRAHGVTVIETLRFDRRRRWPDGAG